MQQSTFTSRFRVANRRILSILFTRYGLTTAAVCIIALLTLCILGAVLDLRYFILGLMLLFIVMPGLAGYLYYYFGLRPATVANMLEHRVGVDSGGIIVETFPTPTDDDPEPAGVTRTYTPGAESRWSASSGGVTVWPSRRADGFLYIPYTAFGSTDEFRIWLDRLKQVIPSSDTLTGATNGSNEKKT